MNKSQRTARRRRGSSRIRPFALVALLALLLLGVGFAWAASWPGFRPGKIAVIGNARVSTARVLSAAAIDPRVNVWLQSSSGISARLLRIRAIEGAAVRRYLPNRIAIVIRERIPVARLIAGGATCAVDRGGHLFPSLPQDAPLPALLSGRSYCSQRRLPAGSTTTRLLTLLSRAEASGVRLAILAHDRYGEDLGVLEDGTLLYIGDGTKLERKFAEIHALERRLHGRWKKIKALDLRAPSTPIVVDGRKIEGGGILSLSAMKGRDKREPLRSPTKTSSSRSRGVSKNRPSGVPQRASFPGHSAWSP